jgi:hypothetical protein
MFGTRLAILLVSLDLQAIVAHGGSFTPNTPGGIDDLIATLPALRQVDGSATLKARSDRFGCLSIERNDCDLAWSISVRSRDETEYGHRELVLGINTHSGHEWISPDEEEAMTCIESILTDPQVHLRGVARRPDGMPVGSSGSIVIVHKGWE